MSVSEEVYTRLDRFLWALTAPLMTQVIISIWKWGTYPFHSVREWYPNFAVYLVARVIPFVLIVYLLWRGLLFTMDRLLAHAGSGLRAIGLVSAVFVVSLSTELGVSAVEWCLYPKNLTQQWYSGSFYMFEFDWIISWVCVFGGISAIVFFVERLTSNSQSI